MTFRDHFSSAADEYASFRPRYPDALFEALAKLTPRRELAWDCATGSGQAAGSLARLYNAVIATDASRAQIDAAPPVPGVTFRVAHAEASGLPDASADLITVAQALHWLDIPAFYREATRVLRAGGALAVWCYGLVEAGDDLDAPLRHFYSETVGPYWPPERHLVDTGYRTLPFPFDEVPLPQLAIEQPLTLESLAGYLRTWSAVQRYREARGADPVAPLVRELADAWGPADHARVVRWPLHVRAGRRPLPTLS